MNLSMFKGITGEFVVLKDLLITYDGIEDNIDIENLWNIYVYLQTKGSKVLRKAEIQHGALVNNTMDFMVRENGKSWRFIEVKATSWPNSTKFHLQQYQDEYLDEPTATLAIVRLPEITKVDFDKIPESIETSKIEYYRHGKYSIEEKFVIIDEKIRRLNYVEERRP